MRRSMYLLVLVGAASAALTPFNINDPLVTCMAEFNQTDMTAAKKCKEALVAIGGDSKVAECDSQACSCLGGTFTAGKCSVDGTCALKFNPITHQACEKERYMCVYSRTMSLMATNGCGQLETCMAKRFDLTVEACKEAKGAMTDCDSVFLCPATTDNPQAGTLCTCITDWKYKGVVYNGCQTTADAPSLPWCYVDSACPYSSSCIAQTESSCATNGQYGVLYCTVDTPSTPCECESTWTAFNCNGDQSGCPDSSCAGIGDSFCAVRNAPCSGVPAPTGGAKGFAFCTPDSCKCLEKWTYGGVEYSGCATTPDSPSVPWCMVSKDCNNGNVHACPDNSPKYHCPNGEKYVTCSGGDSTKPCQCKASWSVPEEAGCDGASSGCPSAVCNGGFLPWCVVENAPCQGVPAPAAGGKAYAVCNPDTCKCLEKWTHLGIEFSGCATTPDHLVPWCYVSKDCPNPLATDCIKVPSSSCTDAGVLKSMYCTPPTSHTPCICKGTWSVEAFPGCKDQKGCPAASCGGAEQAWCEAANAPCIGAPLEGSSTRSFVHCTAAAPTPPPATPAPTTTDELGMFSYSKQDPIYTCMNAKGAEDCKAAMLGENGLWYQDSKMQECRKMQCECAQGSFANGRCTTQCASGCACREWEGSTGNCEKSGFLCLYSRALALMEQSGKCSADTVRCLTRGFPNTLAECEKTGCDSKSICPSKDDFPPSQIACTCLSTWRHHGVTYGGCQTTPDSPSTPWCYTEPSCPSAYPCTAAENSECTANGILSVRYCTPPAEPTGECKCADSWKVDGFGEGCARQQSGCPSAACNGAANYTWCEVTGPCKGVPAPAAGGAKGYAVCIPTECTCLSSWTYGGVSYTGCATTPDSPSVPWCMVSKDCNFGRECSGLDAAKRSCANGEKWVLCADGVEDAKECTCKTSWSVSGVCDTPVAGCPAAACDGGSWTWCAVENAPCKGVPKQPSGESYALCTPDACKCLSTWQHMGHTFHGCATTPDSPSTPWCFVSADCPYAASCTKQDGSSCTTDGVVKYMGCSGSQPTSRPCQCKDTWSVQGYANCSAPRNGCPSQACDGSAYTWCEVANAPCDHVPDISPNPGYAYCYPCQNFDPECTTIASEGGCDSEVRTFFPHKVPSWAPATMRIRELCRPTCEPCDDSGYDTEDVLARNPNNPLAACLKGDSATACRNTFITDEVRGMLDECAKKACACKNGKWEKVGATYLCKEPAECRGEGHCGCVEKCSKTEENCVYTVLFRESQRNEQCSKIGLSDCLTKEERFAAYIEGCGQLYAKCSKEKSCLSAADNPRSGAKEAEDGADELSGGVVAAIVIGTLAGAALLVGLAVWFRNRRQAQQFVGEGGEKMAYHQMDKKSDPELLG